jgi:hypothetical protein
MVWDHPPHNPDKWIADVPGIGRYLIRRRMKGSREHVLMLNDTSTKHYGTVDQLKATVERIVAARQALLRRSKKLEEGQATRGSPGPAGGARGGHGQVHAGRMGEAVPPRDESGGPGSG